MKFMNFIVVNEKIHPDDWNRVTFTVSGEVYIKPEVPVPVIYAGKGCLGIGTVKQLLLTETSTDITFEFAEVGEDARKAYYSLYRNQVSSSSDDGDYESQTDVIIPGAIGSKKSSTRSYSSSGGDYNRPRRSKSLSDFMDDDGDTHW